MSEQVTEKTKDQDGTAAPAACCSTAEKQTCCAPAAKSTCCPPAAAPAGAGCGCK